MRVKSVLTPTVLQTASTESTKMPLNYREIFKGIAETRPYLDSSVFHVIVLARLNNEKVTKASWIYSLTSS